MKHILLVDDDDLLRRSLAFNLEQAGFRVSASATAEDALAKAARLSPDLVLLDIGLPGMDGLEALQHFRQQVGAPVIFVTARRRELDEILGLELGAADYITKPFNLDVLIAHVKAVLRRSEPTAALAKPDPLTVGGIVIDPVGHTVLLNGEPVDLAPRAFDLLYVLAQNAGTVLSTDVLLSRVWGADFEGESQVVYVHIRWLREKLEDDPSRPRRLVTVRGVGYKLMAE